MSKDLEIQEKYTIKIKTKENNEMEVSIGYEDSKLSIKAFFYKNYFKKTFSNAFTLDELKESSSYYKQFNNEKEILKEIINNKLKGEEKIEGNEETSNVINLEIPLPSTNFSKISFELKQVKKSPQEILYEYKYIINLYENKFRIANFNSKILAGKELEKETIKLWISPKNKLEAKLLFSFHDIQYNGDNKSKYTYSLKEDINVRNFHKACDNKYSILVICKSKNEIFGGYTPLCFNSLDEYGKDNESFLFSLNKLEKYPKDNYDKTDSLWCYKNYGPCFHWDLYFREKKIHAVKFEKKNYLTPEKWINKNNCYVNDEGILLDSLEVFQIAVNDRYYHKIPFNFFWNDYYKIKNIKINIEEEKLDNQRIKNNDDKNNKDEKEKNQKEKKENEKEEPENEKEEPENEEEETENEKEENENEKEENENEKEKKENEKEENENQKEEKENQKEENENQKEEKENQKEEIENKIDENENNLEKNENINK